jgi:hypothetical protein
MTIETVDHGPNYMKIDALYAFISVDENGMEGICAFKSQAGWMPMVASDPDRVASIIPIAREMARAGKKEIKLIKVSVREDIETISPF